LESFIRMAPMRFPHEPGLEQQVQRLFKEQVMPAVKNVSSHKSEGGGLISMLANFRRPTSSVFGLFTQPEVREVVYELEPIMWNIFVELSGDPLAKEAVGTIPGGGIFAGAGGLGANPSNQVPRLRGPEKRQKQSSQELSSSCPRKAVRCGDWAAPSRRLHVAARLNVGVRIKDVLRFLEFLGLLDQTQILKDQSRPLSEVLSGSEGDPVNNLLGPVGSGLSQEEPVEEEIVSEDDEGSGGSVAPEEDEERKQLPGLSISFMPKGSLLGVPPPPANTKEESKPKKKGDKDKKDKKEEKEVRTPAEDLACINLTIDAIDALRILAQVLAPSSLEMLQWQSGQDVEAPEIDEHVSILEFVESEIVFAEFLRFWFLMAELTTRRDYKFCRGISLTSRLDLFLRTVISHCQVGQRYIPPDPSAYAVSEKPEKARPRGSRGQETVIEAPEIPGLPEMRVETEKVPQEEHWMGLDGDDTYALRRWPDGYDVQVADW